MKSKLVVLVFAAMVLGGCVSTGTYDQKVAELAACQDERLATQDKIKSELDAGFAAQLELEPERAAPAPDGDVRRDRLRRQRRP